jgi:hypothetical protein
MWSLFGRPPRQPASPFEHQAAPPYSDGFSAGTSHFLAFLHPARLPVDRGHSTQRIRRWIRNLESIRFNSKAGSISGSRRGKSSVQKNELSQQTSANENGSNMRVSADDAEVELLQLR